jgi:hypothetical protein
MIPVVANNFVQGSQIVAVTLTTATANGILYASTTGVVSSSATFTVVPSNVAGRYTISTIGSQIAGIQTTATVTVFDAFGNSIPNYTGTAFATSNTFTGQQLLTFTSSGTTQVQFTPIVQTTEGILYISTNSTALGTSNTFSVSAGFAVATTSTLSTLSADVVVGESTAITLTLRDQFGNTTANINVLELIATTSGTGNATFATLTGSGHIRTTTYTAGTTAYVSASAIVRIDGVTVGTITINQTPATASTLSQLTGVSQIQVGQSTSITLTLRDQFGNTTANMGGVIVTIPSVDVTGLGATTSLLTQQGHIVSFNYTAGTTAYVTVPVTATFYNGQVTLNIVQQPLQAVATQSSIAVLPTTIEVGGSSSAVLTITLRDQFGNTTASVSSVTAAIVTGNASAGVVVGAYTGTTHIRTAMVTSGTVAGTVQVRSFVNGILLATNAITQIPGTTAQFSLTDINGVSLSSTASLPIIAGSTFNVIITARDQFGNTTASFNSDVQITSATANVTAGSLTVGGFVNGSTTVTLTFNAVGTHNVVVSSATPTVISTIANVVVNPEGTELTMNAYLEGLYNTAANVHIPTAVAVELRTGGSLNTSVLARSQAGVLSTNGSVTVRFSGLTNPGPYWVVLRHVGHLPVASSSATTLSLGTNNSFDFRVAANVFDGDNVLGTVGGTRVLRAGDVDGSGVINAAVDAARIIANNGLGTAAPMPQPYVAPVLTGTLTTVTIDKLYLQGYYNTSANTHIPAAVVIELRTGATAETSVVSAMSAGIISTSGIVSAQFGNLNPGSYWVLSVPALIMQSSLHRQQYLQ